MEPPLTNSPPAFSGRPHHWRIQSITASSSAIPPDPASQDPAKRFMPAASASPITLTKFEGSGHQTRKCREDGRDHSSCLRKRPGSASRKFHRPVVVARAGRSGARDEARLDRPWCLLVCREVERNGRRACRRRDSPRPAFHRGKVRGCLYSLHHRCGQLLKAFAVLEIDAKQTIILPDTPIADQCVLKFHSSCTTCSCVRLRLVM